jgi:hypothetical protein
MGWAEGGSAAAKGKKREKFDPDEYTHAKKKLKKGPCCCALARAGGGI